MEPASSDDLLTPREWQVLYLLREGLSNEQIAERLGISFNGAKFHVSEILSKLQVANRIEAVRWLHRHEAAGRPARAGFAAFVRGHGSAPATRIVALAAGGAAVVLLILLLIGVVLMESRQGDEKVVQVATATPGPTVSPEEPALDAIADLLLTGTRSDLEASLGAISASETEEWVIAPDGTVTSQSRPVPAVEWTQALANADRSVYAVVDGTPQYVILAVDTGSERVEGWAFSVMQGAAFHLEIASGTPPGGWFVNQPYVNPQRLTPEVQFFYESFLTLPPAGALPKQPPSHGPGVRTGVAEVDRVTAALESGDAQEVLSLVAPRDALPVSISCPSPFELTDAIAVEALIGGMRVGGLYAIAEVPDGYEPLADHAVVVTVEESPYLWDFWTLFEQDGQIVAIQEEGFCGDMRQEHTQFVVPPQTGAAEPSLRSGVPPIDNLLDAIRDGDAQRVSQLVDWQDVPCVAISLGIGTPPVCQPGQAGGTLVQAIPSSACEGGYLEEREVEEGLFGRYQGWILYAVPDSTRAILISSSPDTAGGVLSATFQFNEKGLREINNRCFVGDPTELLVATRYLLPPP